METAASDGSGADLPRAVHVCRRGRGPVTVQGDPGRGKAVHAVTGRETGPGGHVAAPAGGLVRAATDVKASTGS